MKPGNIRDIAVTGACFVAILSTSVSAQQQPKSAQRQTAAPDHTAMRGWDLMHDGVAFFTFNQQGGDHGGTEFKSQNWWMGMAGRQLGRGMLNVSTAATQATDSVCGLKVDLEAAPQATHGGETYHFCSEEHRQLFQQTREVFAAEE